MKTRVRAAADAPDGPAFHCDRRFLEQMDLCNLTTIYGDFDISFMPAGTRGYADLRKRAVTYALAGSHVPTASLDDVIRSKEAAGRPKDRQQLPSLRTLREESRRHGKE